MKCRSKKIKKTNALKENCINLSLSFLKCVYQKLVSNYIISKLLIQPPKGAHTIKYCMKHIVKYYEGMSRYNVIAVILFKLKCLRDE